VRLTREGKAELLMKGSLHTDELMSAVVSRETGLRNMLAKSLSFLADADAAGIVLGARVPIILTSRADSVLTRLASCAVSVLAAKARREALTQAFG
jgi:phosphotransacetylase